MFFDLYPLAWIWIGYLVLHVGLGAWALGPQRL